MIANKQSRKSLWCYFAFLMLLSTGFVTADVGDDLYDKAQRYDTCLANHIAGTPPELNPNHDPSRDGYGFALEIEYTDDTRTRIKHYDGMGDSVFLTGLTLASQCYRYQVTGETEAMDNIERMVWALHHALKVTETPGYVARFVGPYVQPYRHGYNVDSAKVNAGTGEYQGTYWISETSRDQYLGWFLGLWLAHPLVEASLQAVIEADVKEVIDTLEANGYLIIAENHLPSFSTPYILSGHKISWHFIAADILNEPEYWVKANLAWLLYKDGYKIDSSTAWTAQYMGYYAFNLEHMTIYPMFEMFDNWKIRELMLWYEPNVRTHVARTHNAWFDLVYLIGQEKLILKNQQDIDAVKAHIIESLVNFYDAPKLKEHPTSYQTPPQLDPIAKAIQDLIKDLNNWLASLGVGYSLPVPDDYASEPFSFEERCRGTFQWQRNPKKFNCGTPNLAFEYIGADYLLAYWMGRFYGVVPGP